MMKKQVKNNKYKLLVPLGVHKKGEILEELPEGDIIYTQNNIQEYMPNRGIPQYAILMMIKLKMIKKI